jgi:hypothetical protein
VDINGNSAQVKWTKSYQRIRKSRQLAYTAENFPKRS